MSSSEKTHDGWYDCKTQPPSICKPVTLFWENSGLTQQGYKGTDGAYHYCWNGEAASQTPDKWHELPALPPKKTYEQRVREKILEELKENPANTFFGRSVTEVTRILKEHDDRQHQFMFPTMKLSPQDSVRERYTRDNAFRRLVDLMYMEIDRATYTPTEIREAAMLAQSMYEGRRPPRPVMFKPFSPLGL